MQKNVNEKTNLTFEEKYQVWLNEPKMPEYLLKELKKMKNKVKEERFSKDLEFGTGGLRGLIGAGTNGVNIFTVSKVTEGYANYLLENEENCKQRGVAICYDNRHHSFEFAKVVAEVLAAKGIKTFVYKELRPTPMASFAVRYFKCAGGVMITASHNPREYNGYKVYNSEGAQLNLKEADAVIKHINKVTDLFNIQREQDSKLIKYVLEDVQKAYVKEVHNIRLNVTKEEVDYSLRVLYSPMHGTGTNIVPVVLQDEGFDVVPYEPHMIIDPNFKNAKVVNPEFPKAWEGLPKYAKKENCDLIVMTDPDADRLGVAVRHKDEYLLLNGNQEACVLLYYILSQKQQRNLLPAKNKGFVVSTIVSSSALETITNHFGFEYHATLTGFKFIAEMITKLPNKEFLFGAEESIGSIISSFVRDKDGVQGALMFSEIAGWLKKQKKTLIDYLNEIYSEIGYYLEYTHNIDLKGKEGSERIQRIMEFFRNNHLQLKCANVVKLEDVKTLKSYDITYEEDENNQRVRKVTESGKIDLPSSNVLKFYLEDGGWVIFRPSGTEPKIKIYFEVVKEMQERAESFMQKLVTEVLDLVSKI